MHSIEWNISRKNQLRKIVRPSDCCVIAYVAHRQKSFKTLLKMNKYVVRKHTKITNNLHEKQNWMCYNASL